MLKNYTSGNSIKNPSYTFDKITKILIEHKAKSISYDYSADGKITALTFRLVIGDKGEFGIKLPARTANVERLFKQQGIKYKEDQPYRTAWANIRDWLDAQMALIDTEQAKLEEIFLPYFVYPNGQTFFEKIEQDQFRVLGAGPIEGEIVE